MTDEAREHLIEMFRQLGEKTRDREERCRYYEAMRHHISERSPEQIARMEAEKGLR